MFLRKWSLFASTVTYVVEAFTRLYFLLLFEIHIGCGMMQVQSHCIMPNKCGDFFVYVIQHHVKALPLKFTVTVS